MLTRMPPTSEIYRNEEAAPRTNRVRPVKSELALHALSIFPRKDDVNILLKKERNDSDIECQPTSFADFLKGKP